MRNSKQNISINSHKELTMATSSNAAGITKRTSFNFADPAFIVRRPGWNVRFDFGDIEGLKNSIKANGFKINKPLEVRRNADNKFEIIDGDRRFTAVEELIKEGMAFPDGIPIVIADKNKTDLENTISMLVDNNGKELLPLEEAAGLKRLRDAGLTLKEICEKVGRSNTHVNATLALLDADDSVKEAVKEKKIAGTTAKKIAVRSRGNKEAQKKMVEKATSGIAGRRAVTAEVKAPKQVKKRGEAAERVVMDKLVIDGLSDDMFDKLNQNITKLGVEDLAKFKASLAGKTNLMAAFYLGAYLTTRNILGFDETPTI